MGNQLSPAWSAPAATTDLARGVRLIRIVAPLHLASVLALACLIILVPDAGFDWNRTVVVLGGVAIAAGLAMDGARLDRRSLISLLPYAGYAAALLSAWWAHPSDAGTRELWQVAAFFGLIGAVAPTRRPGAFAAGLVAALALASWQVLGPRSVAMLSGRALHFKSLDQWGGYPEIGLVAAVGAAGSTALVVAGRRLPLRIAGAVLTAAFTAATIYVYARSAVLTIVLTAVWLIVVRFVTAAPPRRRGWLLAGTVGVVAAICLVTWLVRPADVRRLSTAFGQSPEVTVRLDGWRTATAMLRDHPLFGVGPGRYSEEYARYSTRQDPAHAYHIFFHTAAELGLFGLLAYVALWTRVLRLTLTRASGAGPAAFAAHGMLVAFLLRSQSEHFLSNLSTSYRMLLFLGLLFGLAEACARTVTSSRTPAASALRTASPGATDRGE